MNARDKIHALWLNAEMIFNALEELDEDISFSNDHVRVYGASAGLTWDRDARRWRLLEVAE